MMSALLLPLVEKDLLRLLFRLPGARCLFTDLIEKCREWKVSSWSDYNEIDDKVERFIINHLTELEYVYYLSTDNNGLCLYLSQRGRWAVKTVIGTEFGAN